MRLSTSSHSAATSVGQSDAPTEVAAPSLPRRAWRGAWRAVGWMLVFVAIAAAVGGVAWISVQLGVTQSDLLRWQEVVGRWRTWSALAHTVVVMLIGWRWSAIVAWGHRKGIVKASEYEQVLALRDKVLLFLAVYVLAVVIGPATLARLF